MLLVYYHKEGEGEGNVKLCRPREIPSKCLHICDITKIHHTCTQKKALFNLMTILLTTITFTVVHHKDLCLISGCKILPIALLRFCQGAQQPNQLCIFG